MPEKRSDHLPPLFAAIWLRLVRRARECGYALALHGSMVTDLDVVAIPWTEEAVSAREIADALAQELGWIPESVVDEPVKKPHGRVAYSLWMGYDTQRDPGGADPKRTALFLDLSIMPRTSIPKESPDA